MSRPRLRYSRPQLVAAEIRMQPADRFEDEMRRQCRQGDLLLVAALVEEMRGSRIPAHSEVPPVPSEAPNVPAADTPNPIARRRAHKKRPRTI